MIDFLSQMINQFGTVIQAAIAVAASVYVAGVWWKTKALVPTITAVVMAGLVVWATGNVELLEGQIDVDAQTWVQ
ncbi:hypothetical protein [Euzebya tangerina]|uniref:hypothetical protein n=1 Tax=Euzebya tangerina TaxID=591198 RepID=UPI000E31A830|nr:hypothetical protein [Euzebya tangerina]